MPAALASASPPEIIVQTEGTGFHEVRLLYPFAGFDPTLFGVGAPPGRAV